MDRLICAQKISLVHFDLIKDEARAREIKIAAVRSVEIVTSAVADSLESYLKLYEGHVLTKSDLANFISELRK